MKEILQIFNQSLLDNTIEASKYQYYGVKKGLRNEDHTGVLVGLTRIADVVGYEKVDDEKIECEGKLYYRDYEINEMFDHVDIDKHLGFEQCAFLLLFGHLPSSSELTTWLTVIREHVELPKQFLENNILTCKSSNMMNRLQQALLGLYAYDCHADDASVSNTLVQGIQLIAKMPALIVYHYQAKIHTFDHASLIIHPIDPNDTISESILRLVRKDQNFTESEVQLLDTLLILHADHGEGIIVPLLMLWYRVPERICIPR